jgi:hypothetical protein
VLLMVQRTQRELPGYEGPREEATQDKGTLKVSSCQAYDYLLLAALKAQVSSQQGRAGARSIKVACRQLIAVAASLLCSAVF